MSVTRRRFLASVGSVGAAMALNGCGILTGRHGETRELTLAIVSDIHLGKDPTTLPSGSDRATTPAARMADIVREINESPAELTLFMGDLVDTGAKHEDQYPEWAKIANRLAKPWRAVPGNHDPQPLFEKYVHPLVDCIDDQKGIRFVFFQDSLATSHDGAVTPEQVAWMAARIDDAKARGMRVVLCTHVPRHPNRSPDMGWYVRGEEPALREMVEARRGTIIAIFSGHLHCSLRGWSDLSGIHELVMPSACWNFEKDLSQAPGFAVKEYRPAWVLATIGPERLTLNLKPVGDDALPPVVLSLPAAAKGA